LLAEDADTPKRFAGLLAGASSKQTPPRGNLPATPREAAAALLEGMAKSNWDQVATVLPRGFALTQQLKDAAGALQVISIGEPVCDGAARCKVPYQVKFRNGEANGGNLFLHNDNVEHRWVLDGGL
jgi:hypothetical protein